MSKLKKIFISHVHGEKELAQCLKRRLNKSFCELLEIFVSSDDGKTIKAGKKWLEEVEKALRVADMQIVLCSKESVGRPWVNFEAGAVWLKGIPVIPICHSGMKPSDLPVPLSMLQGIEGNKPEGIQQLYEAVADKFRLKMPKVDFQDVAREMKELEKKCEQRRRQQQTKDELSKYFADPKSLLIED